VDHPRPHQPAEANQLDCGSVRKRSTCQLLIDQLSSKRSLLVAVGISRYERQS
jgi:hypothetical protein